MKIFSLILIVTILVSSCQQPDKTITTATLLEEMTDLTRLTEYSEYLYKTVQYSSYDRRSTSPDKPYWFANDDGFGNEAIPGFQQVLKEADEDGIGEYLMCDIQSPGAIVRLWTAGIDGNIRFFLDDMSKPVFEGKADDFFRKPIDVLSGNTLHNDSLTAYRQYDAVYFPLLFEKRCKIIWIGNIKKIHFYHIGVRIYRDGTKVEASTKKNMPKYSRYIEEINEELSSGTAVIDRDETDLHQVNFSVPSGEVTEIFRADGTSAIDEIKIKLTANDFESVLRKTVMRIYFDDNTNPMVQAPIGDFFIAAPGFTPYQSLPMAMFPDSTLICRFVMPFRQFARIEIENFSDEEIVISGSIGKSAYTWDEERTLYFNADWKMDYDLVGHDIGDSTADISDIAYLNYSGKGRIVGAAALIYNPSNVPTSWGNWWGEGDEKIFIDQDSFPSFFGTGSEDYFNYSWSSSRLFSFPYCGQPRNDGPGNRGYVSNFRWHILDDIPFSEKAAFYMELGHHGLVKGINYGRIIYYYAQSEEKNQKALLKKDDLRDISYTIWNPQAFKGSSAFHFIQAENVFPDQANLQLVKGDIYAGAGILIWNPAKKGDTLYLDLKSEKADHESNIGFTLLHGPDCGSFSMMINGKKIKINGREILDLYMPYQKVLDNHFTEKFQMKKGINSIVLLNEESLPGKQVGIDFIWLRN